MAGLYPAEPGYRVVGVRPVVGGGLRSASADVTTPYGRAAVSWRADDGAVRLEATIPPGTAGRVELGDGAVHEVGAGRHGFTWTVAP